MVEVPGFSIPEGVVGKRRIRVKSIGDPQQQQHGPVVMIDMEIMDGPARGFILEKKMFSFKSSKKSKLGQLFRACLPDPGRFDTDNLIDKECIAQIIEDENLYPTIPLGGFSPIPESGSESELEAKEEQEESTNPDQEAAPSGDFPFS